jgi:hypothetical protein
MVVHIAAFAIGATFAWVAFKREQTLLGLGFTLFAAAEVVYMTYHLDWTVFLFAHTIAEVLDLGAFVLVFFGPSTRSRSGERARRQSGMTTRRVIAFLAIAAVAVAAGCGGSESSEPVATTQVTMAKSYPLRPEGDRGRRRLDRDLDERRQLHAHREARRPGGSQGRSWRERLDRVRHGWHLPLRLHPPQPGHERRGGREVKTSDLERDLVIVVCAISAGIHGALAPEHFGEGAGAGLGFLVSALLLAGLAVALTRGAGPPALVRDDSRAGGSDRRVRPGRHVRRPRPPPEVEAVNGLALATKSIEIVGLIAAAHLVLRDRPVALLTTERTLT